MQDQRSNKSKQNRTVYLDLQHELLAPAESESDGTGADIIHCANTGHTARILSDGFKEPELGYCSECYDLFDPEDTCLKITVLGEGYNINIVTLVQ